MPPLRTIPPAKPLKTERTHEENQERAYIAASRRSDRSLEARVESARRASEIHKKRTGRSLRVTEQDVINEEMYEEEDDDLPLQYRRLTQHLQTGSADFNKRLSAYLTQHVAMRSALEQGIAQSYAQQPFPGSTMAPGQYGIYQNPLLAQQQQQQMMLQHQQQQQQQSQQQYAQSPYSHQSPTVQHKQHPQSHQRSASIAAPQQLTASSRTSSSPIVPNLASRRMSMPPSQLHQSSSGDNPPALTPGSSNSSASPGASASSRAPPPSFPAGSFNPNFCLPQYQNGAFGSTDFMGFSTALPPESQQLLAGALDPNDPMTSLLMAGADNLPQYDFSTRTTVPAMPYGSQAMKTSGPQHYPTFDGLNSTLSQANTGPDLDMAKEMRSDNAMSQSFFDAGMIEHGSGDMTPGAGETWSLFMNDDKWDVPASQ